MTYLDLITDALSEIRVARGGDVIEAESADLALRALNRLIDAWNADGQTLYVVTRTAYPLTPGLDPHTLGLAANTPTWTITTSRPVAIEGATLIHGTARTPLTIRDEAWWRAQWEHTLMGQPTDVFYDPTWPNGSVHLSPIPSAADTLELAAKAVLAQVALTDDVSLPEGYADALMYTLAERLAAPFGQQLSPRTVAAGLEARATAFRPNRRVPRLVTSDAGIPNGSPCAGANIPRFQRGY